MKFFKKLFEGNIIKVESEIILNRIIYYHEKRGWKK